MAPKFVSLGMVVLDELHFPSSATMYDVLGGSGAFSTLGARIVAGKEHASEVGCIVMAGDDFPLAIRHLLDSWGLNLVVTPVPGRMCTRGRLTYEDEVFGRM